MRPVQALLLYLWGVLCFAVLLGVPGAELVGLSTLGALVSVAGLAHELLTG